MMHGHVIQDTVSTHLMVLQIMEQLLNKAGDVFVGQFMRLGTSAKLLEIAGPLDKTSETLLTNGVKNVTEDEPDLGVADSSNDAEGGKEPDSSSGTKEPEVEVASGFDKAELKSDSVEPGLESSSKPPDSESKLKEQESEPHSKKPSKQPDTEAEPSLESSKEPDLESSQEPELVASKEQDSGSSREPDLVPSQQPDLTSSKELNTDSVMEPELEESESSKKPDKEASLSEEPVRFIFTICNPLICFLT